MSMPPEILKLLKQAIAQQESENRRLEQIQDEIRDSIADLGVCVSSEGFHVMLALAGAIAHSMHSRCEGGENCKGMIQPREAVALADKFMLRWAKEREGAPFRHQVVDEMFLTIPEVKLQ